MNAVTLVESAVGAFPGIAVQHLGPCRFQVSIGETGRFLWPNWRSGHELRAWLLTRSPGDRSGDIYARAEA